MVVGKTVVKTIGIVVLCALLALSLFACKKKEKASPERIANVITAMAVKERQQPSIDAVGALEAAEQVIISAEVEGALQNMSIEEGQKVTKGALIAAVDDTNYQLAVSQAQAAYNQALANLQNAAAELKRREALFSEQLVTKQDFDNICTKHELAKQEVERAASTLNLAKERLKKCQILAPLGGFIKEKKVSAGDFMRVGSPLCVIINTNTLKLTFTVTESDAGRVRVGQDVVFSVDTFPDKKFRGKISALAAYMEERTRTLRVEATLKNPNFLLKPGFFSKATVFVGAPIQVVLIPANAVAYEGGASRVFIVDNGTTARMRDVTIGDKYGDMVEIVKGVNAGEAVIVVGQNNLGEGAKVNVAR